MRLPDHHFPANQPNKCAHSPLQILANALPCIHEHKSLAAKVSEHLNIPSREEVRQELRARLLADSLRLATLFGAERVHVLAGKTTPVSTGLVQPSLNRAPWDLTVADFDLDSIPAGQMAMAMYDYAFDFRHPLGMTPDVFSAEVEGLEDLATSYSSDLFDVFFTDSMHTGDVPRTALLTLCMHTRARLRLDTGAFLTVKDIALLARMTERSVRNMLSISDDQQRLHADNDVVENVEARRWLSGRRGFARTFFQQISQIPGEHPDAITNWVDLGHYLHARWAGLGKSSSSAAKELDWHGDRAAYLKALSAEPQMLDPKDCEAIARTLLVSPAWFTAQVMRLKYPREVQLLMEASATPALLPKLAPAADAARASAECKRLEFVLQDGTRLHPVRMKNRATKKVAFRVSAGGTGGNTLEAGEEIEDENEMIDLVVHKGYAVRMAGDKGGMKSLYKLRGRSVREAYLDGQQVQTAS